MEKLGARRLEILENYRSRPNQSPAQLEAIENQEKQLERANAIIERARAALGTIEDNWNAQYAETEINDPVEVP